jgi:hypothetical protein
MAKGETIFGWDGEHEHPIRIDKSTHALTTIEYGHHEVHDGSHYECYDGTANIGAEAAPLDAIQLTFLTPATKEVHLVIHAKCSAAAVYTFTEGYTGEGTGGSSVVAYNKNRGSLNTAGMVVEKEATAVVTGGTVLETYTLSTGKFDAGESRSAQEWVLKKNTKYAVGLYLNAAGVATIQLSWYEHTYKG